jgi:hypothetical protein
MNAGHLSVHCESQEISNPLWLWHEYRAGIQSIKFKGTMACFGYNSGRVVVVDLAAW